MKVIYRGKTKTGKEILIRYPEMGDLEKLLEYINTLSDERTFIRAQGEHQTLESEKKWLEDRLKEIEEKKSVHLLVFSGDALAGASEIHMMDRTEKHIGILGITIAKKFRGEGIGKTLMDLIIKEAKKELPELKIITLEVFSTNEIARNMYKKVGFIEYGLLPEGITRNGKFEDGVLMYKKVNTSEDCPLKY
jgi:RimJ/RimL family protein N-acetyltransferase